MDGQAEIPKDAQKQEMGRLGWPRFKSYRGPVIQAALSEPTLAGNPREIQEGVGRHDPLLTSKP